MSRETDIFHGGTAAIQRLWQTLTMVFCLACAALPLNMAGPIGAVALIESEASSGSEAYVAFRGDTFRQLTRRAFNPPAPAEVQTPPADLSHTVSTYGVHLPHRGAMRDRNGCGAPLLL